MTTWTWFDGKWREGNPKVLGPMNHAVWLGSCVFDGARYFEGVAPDLDRHCTRVVNSAKAFALQPQLSAGEIAELATEVFVKFPSDAALYIRPMFWADEGFVDVDPRTTRFALCVYDAPMPAFKGFSAMLSRYRKPTPETAPTEAKAACHYPNSARVLREVRSKGFDNGVMLDPLGNVAEFATANIFIAKDGALHTPAPNGTFLNGITRQRIIKLMRDAGVKVFERAISWQEVMEADEVFSTGNWSKVMPVTRIEDRELQPGPLCARARELYWAFAHGEIRG